MDRGWERRLGRALLLQFLHLATFDPKFSMEWGMAFWGTLNSKGLGR